MTPRGQSHGEGDPSGPRFLSVCLSSCSPGTQGPPHQRGAPQTGLRGWGRMQLSPSEGYVGGLGEEQERWRWVTEQVGVTLRA